MPPAPPLSRFVSAPDGLRLHTRCYNDTQRNGIPVVCLPGLTRCADDFEDLAMALAYDPAASRRVIAIDSRGRGQSAFDDNPDNYTIAVELNDILAVMTALSAPRAIIVGTSRGGLIAMTMAAVRPSAIAAVVLNDIGPVIELQGLMRIKGYAGKLPLPASMEDGATALRRLFSNQFPNLSADDWLRFSARTFKTAGNGLALNYDPKIADGLKSVSPDRPLPALWPQFDALANVPVMAIRGELSDLLSVQTLEMMRAHHPGLDVLTVPQQGHAPMLDDEPTIKAISAFIAQSPATSAH